jgi:hypothetical protein
MMGAIGSDFPVWMHLEQVRTQPLPFLQRMRFGGWFCIVVELLLSIFKMDESGYSVATAIERVILVNKVVTVPAESVLVQFYVELVVTLRSCHNSSPFETVAPLPGTCYPALAR